MKRLICFALLFVTACAQVPQVETSKWGDVKTPSAGAPKIYGGYSAGCIAGAKDMPRHGAGFELVRTERNRFYGHPELTSYLKSLGHEVRKIGGSIQVSDMSQPRGGPMLYGHSSHQVGLDADIWYGKTGSGEDAKPVDLADTVKNQLITWKPYYARLIELSAKPDVVERVFVHATIKRKLCETEQGKDWLYKVRPWWGHHDHLHVRLKCPSGDSGCKPQEGLDRSKDGCDETLGWWFSEEAHQEFLKKQEEKKDPKVPVLPEECARLLEP